MTFREAYKNAPEGIVATASVTLKRQPWDASYLDRQYSEGYREGAGSKDDPLRYRSAASVSPFYATIDLWYAYRNSAVWIQVNSWKFHVSNAGVVSEDGHFTLLFHAG